jgi:hypothetical protein
MDDKQISISEDNVNDFQIFCFISQGNPGAISILMNMIKNIDHNELSIFLNNIISKEILGARLWYIYKNECNNDINELIEKDLTPFDNQHFYEKFEKYL